jgi:hypothetical protein
VIADTTLITLNKGRDAHLARLLEGVARGPHPEACIIVEMGAEPAPLPDHGFPIRRIVLDSTGLPLARARNAGRRAATTERLIFLDVDCIPSADLVPRLSADLAEADGLICCEIRYLPAGVVTDGWTETGLRVAGQPHPVRQFPSRGRVRSDNPGLFWSLAFGIRATTFDRLGGFDEGFDGYGAEDTDLAFRADTLGIPILFSAGGQAFHQHHLSCDPPLQHFADIVRNAARFRERHGLWPMDGWLDAFAARGLINAGWRDDLQVLRQPGADEIAMTRVPADRPF